MEGKWKNTKKRTDAGEEKMEVEKRKEAYTGIHRMNRHQKTWWSMASVSVY